MPEAEEPEAIDTLFEDAVDALRQGERARGKEILTRLLKADQNNPAYWVWMSAAVDTVKERLYCLETALKLDPENAIARRGLVLLGGLPPGEDVQPFPLNRPRAWEQDLLLAHERPDEPRPVLGSPAARLAVTAVLGLLVMAAAYFGFFNPKTASFFRPAPVRTLGPTATFTLTPTFVNATTPAQPTLSGPTPLAALMGVNYTPTPLYVNTPRAPVSADYYRSAKIALQKGDVEGYISQMEQIRKAEPTAADVPYLIAEAYRQQGDCREALNAYNESLQVDDQFAPGYLGLARARICIDPGADTTQLYELAIQADPTYGEPYLDRANFNLVRRDWKAALPDLQQAEKLMPDSALVQLSYSQAYLLGGDSERGLAAARKANRIDQTLLPSYYYLGYAEAAGGNYAQAIKPLQTYLLYQTRDGAAYALLGQAYVQTGDYQSALSPLKQALKYDPNQVRSLIYLGTASLRTDDLENADYYFKRALEYFPDSFEANIGLTETMYRNGTFGSAYLQAETSKSKAEGNTQLALALYWRALSQEGRKAFGDALADWKALLAMPEEAMTAGMRKTAQEHLSRLATATPTPKPGAKTPTATPTPRSSGTPAVTGSPATPTRTPTPGRSPTPTKTPSLTPTV